MGTLIATGMEFICGCIVNILLGWEIWDYSNLPGNVLGQICPQYTLLWMPITTLAIILDDIIRYKFYGEEKSYYTLF